MNSLLVLDFESKDLFIPLKLGQGWAYPKNESMFKILGYSIGRLEEGQQDYLQHNEQNFKNLQRYLESQDGIICHGAQYELGCLYYLGAGIKNLKVYDTEIIAKLYDNTLMKYDLESLTKKYLLEKYWKDKSILVSSALKNNLQPDITSGLTEEATKKHYKKVEKWCYENMDILQEKDPEAVATYCNQDIIATRELFKLLVSYDLEK